MELVVFGLIFGTMMGCGIYFLILRPALREREQERERERVEASKRPSEN